MAHQVFCVDKLKEFRMAGANDLIELLPVSGNNALYLPKWLVETLVYAIVRHEFIHLSGPTGSAKSSLLEALSLVPENFRAICRAQGYRELPLRVFPIEMATYEAPGELFQRRALKNGTTYDETSKLVNAIEEAAKIRGDYYVMIWLREMGRVHSSSVQGGLLNLMTKSDIVLPDGRHLDGQGIAWAADSNYQAEQDSTHTLVTFDDALRRRFSVNLTMDYLSAEQEAQILGRLVEQMHIGQGGDGLIAKVVKLGNVIRRHRAEGNLQSVAPPTIYGYLAFLRMIQSLTHLTPQQAAMATLLGNASRDDQKHVTGVLNEVFGLRAETGDDPTMGGNLF
jgi:hypothetical protein